MSGFWIRLPCTFRRRNMTLLWRGDLLGCLHIPPQFGGQVGPARIHSSGDSKAWNHFWSYHNNVFAFLLHLEGYDEGAMIRLSHALLKDKSNHDIQEYVKCEEFFNKLAQLARMTHHQSTILNWARDPHGTKLKDAGNFGVPYHGWELHALWITCRRFECCLSHIYSCEFAYVSP